MLLPTCWLTLFFTFPTIFVPLAVGIALAVGVTFILRTCVQHSANCPPGIARPQPTPRPSCRDLVLSSCVLRPGHMAKLYDTIQGVQCKILVAGCQSTILGLSCCHCIATMYAFGICHCSIAGGYVGCLGSLFNCFYLLSSIYAEHVIHGSVDTTIIKGYVATPTFQPLARECAHLIVVCPTCHLDCVP